MKNTFIEYNENIIFSLNYEKPFGIVLKNRKFLLSNQRK